MEGKQMLPSKQVLADLICRIYDAAADPSLWELFLEQVSKISRGTSAALVMHHLGHKMHTISASWNIDPRHRSSISSTTVQSTFGRCVLTVNLLVA